MAKPVHNLQLSQQSIDAIARINKQMSYTVMGSYLVAAGHVFNIMASSSGHANRVVSISFAQWEEWQALSNYSGLAKAWVDTCLGIIKNEACNMVIKVNDAAERQFWQDIAGDRCKVW